MHDPRTGVLLINLGTPDAPRTAPVRRYLREFLSDPLVIDSPAPVRWALLNFVILPFRPRRSAEAYRKIWTAEGSPLLTNSHALRRALGDSLGPSYVVDLAMRYGRPSIRGALHRLHAADVARILAVPLFPQYSTAATGSAIACLEQELAAAPELPPHELLPPCYADPRFVRAWVEVAQPELEAFRPDHVLFSYHGLPERQVKATDKTGKHCLQAPGCCAAVGSANRDCYRAQSFATTRAVAAVLGLETDAHGTAFQSRLGRIPWIQPYTDEMLKELADAGHRRLAILCPAFVADCLETLEEIGIRARDAWRELGGEDLLLVPSLNDHPAWVDALARMVRERA
jgi:ferrochelatase